MVYLRPRSINTTCVADFSSSSNLRATEIEACQKEAKTAYCWPPNGTRICIGNNGVPVYWPPSYYNESSKLSLWYNGGISTKQRSAASGTLGNYLHLMYFLADEIPGSTNERSMNITITERLWLNSSYTDYINHQGPTLILVDTYSDPIPSATPSAAPDGNPLKSGQIAGIAFGSLVGLVFIGMIIYSCCLGYCFPGKAETKRVKAAERRRIREEQAQARPYVDAIKQAVALREVWNGPVRPGGTWVQPSDWPASPRPVARPAPRGDDEIRAVDLNEEQRIEEQRAELQRIEQQRREEQRQEEQRIAERRQEIIRAGEVELPAYEAPPPKYTPWHDAESPPRGPNAPPLPSADNADL